MCFKSKWPLTFDYCLYSLIYIYIYKLYNFFYSVPNEKFNCWDLWLSNLGGKGAISIMYQQVTFGKAQKCHFMEGVSFMSL
jgi:hypothetical protein